MGAFTTKDFATLLDEVLSADQHETFVSAARPSMPFDILFDRQDIDAPPSFHDPELAAEYLFAAADSFAVEPEVAGDIEQPSVTPHDIARELGLTGRETPDALDRIRREFAFANHPDRVAEALRDCAMVRMQIANHMIDDAKRRFARIAAVG